MRLNARWWELWGSTGDVWVVFFFFCHLERHLWDWVWVSAYAAPALRFCSMVHLAALAFQSISSPIPVMLTLIIEAVCGNQHYVLDSSILAVKLFGMDSGFLTLSLGGNSSLSRKWILSSVLSLRSYFGWMHLFHRDRYILNLACFRLWIYFITVRSKFL